jgi:hypothetical protein
MPNSDAQKSSARRFQFPLWGILALVAACAFATLVATNWEPLMLRWKYGTPVDLASVSFEGINDDSMMLTIDGARVMTESSKTLNKIIFGLVTDDEPDLEDMMKIGGVWRKGYDPVIYTVRIGDEYVQCRQ